MFSQNYNLGYPSNFLIQAPPLYYIGGIQVDADGYVIINDVQGKVLGGGSSAIVGLGVDATVTGYATGQNPAAQVLINPAYKLATSAAGYVRIQDNTLDVATLTQLLKTILFTRFVTTGTTIPTSADSWNVSGIFNNQFTFVAQSLGTTYWFNGTNWIMSGTVGSNGTGYWQSATSSPWSTLAAHGTASGTPVILAHGPATLAQDQPDSPVLADTVGTTKLLAMTDGGSPAKFTAPALSNTPSANSPTDAKLDTALQPDPTNPGAWRLTAGAVGNVVTSVDPAPIAAALATALAGKPIIIQSPVGAGTLQITAKDAYLSADGRALTWGKPTGANWPTDLTGWTITFTATRNTNNPNNTSTTTITTSGSIVAATGAQQVQVELPSTLTTGLGVGIGNQGYNFDVVATKGSDRATLIKGTMSVLANVTA